MGDDPGAQARIGVRLARAARLAAVASAQVQRFPLEPAGALAQDGVQRQPGARGMTAESIDPNCAVAHGADFAGPTDRLLVAVFASPVSSALVHFGGHLGFRTLLVEPDEARRGEANVDPAAAPMAIVTVWKCSAYVTCTAVPAVLMVNFESSWPMRSFGNSMRTVMKNSAAKNSISSDSLSTSTFPIMAARTGNTA